MRLCLCIAICLLLGASSALALEVGTIETGGSVDLRLSPSPWMLAADAHLLYYMAPMLGVGPYGAVVKEEDIDATYRLGLAGKLYLPMAYSGGKLTPYVLAGFGVATVEVFDMDELEWQTDTKAQFLARVGFDYWLTPNWTVWAGYQAEKIFVEDLDWQSFIRVGVSTFIKP